LNILSNLLETMFPSRFARVVGSAQVRHSSTTGIQRIGVVGGGQMGMGIALVSALHAQRSVVVVDSSSTQLDRGVSLVEKILAKDVAKGKVTQEAVELARSRISTGLNLEDLSSCDFVIEAVTENFDVKKGIFQELDKILSTEALLCSNTSSISITKLAATTSRAENFCGMHFMNPVPVMQLVEVIPGLGTSEKTKATVIALAEEMGKTTAVSKDMPGFIANRILMPWLNEACIALQEGVATAEDIDKTMTLGTNVPMGPFTLADFIGLDTCLYICEVMHKELGSDKYAPSPLLRQYVDAGRLGRKSGRGFYDYTNTKKI